MSRLRELYKRYIYGIMGTLVFHILIVSAFLITEINFKGKIKDDEILIDFPVEKSVNLISQKAVVQKSNIPSNSEKLLSNKPINDVINKDPFFDDNYKKEIQAAKEIVKDVNKQLAKEIPEAKKFKMPVQNTKGINPDSIKNTIYSGESNIHYFLKERYHLQLPIPIYLAKGGGVVKIKIEVNRDGKVIKTQIEEISNINDPMLPQYALEAASNTIFNQAQNAPTLQNGYIIYTFVPQ